MSGRLQNVDGLIQLENATSARGIAKMDFGESQKNLYSGVSTSDSGAGFLKSRIVVLLREASQ
jgi:hypothetical protein